MKSDIEYPNELEHISVRNENVQFGILRKAGTTIYNKTNKKIYFLTVDCNANQSLASVSDKTEM